MTTSGTSISKNVLFCIFQFVLWYENVCGKIDKCINVIICDRVFCLWCPSSWLCHQTLQQVFSSSFSHHQAHAVRFWLRDCSLSSSFCTHPSCVRRAISRHGIYRRPWDHLPYLIIYHFTFIIQHKNNNFSNKTFIHIF